MITTARDGVISAINSTSATGELNCSVGNYRNNSSHECYEVTREFSCSEDSDCSEIRNNSHCSDSKCECNSEYIGIHNDTECVLIEIEMFCNSDDICRKYFAYSKCYEHRCECLEDFEIDDRKMECMARYDMKERCLSDVECIQRLNHSSCFENRCTCLPDYISKNISIGNVTYEDCVLRATSNDLVKFENKNCSVMNNETELLWDDIFECICETGYIPDFNSSDVPICAPRTLSHNDNCTDTLHCNATITNAICLNNKCVCDFNHTPVSDHQCRKRRLYDYCLSEDECTNIHNHSQCVNDTCLCKKGYQANELLDSCARRRVGMSSCNHDRDCHRAVNNSMCSAANICQCQLGYNSVDGGTVCRSVRILDNCSNDEHCYISVGNSFCGGNFTCACLLGYVPDESLTRCLKLKINDGFCGSDLECSTAVNNSICLSDTCTCVSGYAVGPDHDACIRRKLGDQNCSTKPDCSDAILNGNCSQDGVCVCDTGHYSVANESYTCTRRILNDNSTCSEDIDCSSVIDYSVCDNSSRCHCVLGYIGSLNNSYCQPRILKDVCQINEDCNTTIESSLCLNEKCACLSGYTNVSASFCRKRVVGADDCNEDRDCYDAVRNSICESVSKHFVSELHFAVGNPRSNSKMESNDRQDGDENGGSSSSNDSDCTSNSSGSIGDSSSSISSSNINNSSSRNAILKMKRCFCQLGHYEEQNGTVCTRRVIGDGCKEDTECYYAVSHSICDTVHKNCTCDYDHMVEWPVVTKCVDRPVIEQYKPDEVLRTFRTTMQCGRVNRYHKYSQQCARTRACDVGWKYRGMYDRQINDCFHITILLMPEANVYKVRLNSSMIVGRYELVPLKFNSFTYTYNITSDSYWENNLRIGFYGVDMILRDWAGKIPDGVLTSKNSTYVNIASRFLSSKILNFKAIPDGIQTEIAVHFKLSVETSITDMNLLNEMLFIYLNISEGQVGLSKIYTTKPYHLNVRVEDFDECDNSHSTKEKNSLRYDCDLNAICIKLDGYYKCVCNNKFTDVNMDGRTCKHKDNVLLQFEINRVPSE
ncbi:hypothetical protein HELRODRAFT_171175 [Helobdella robusta]|uniref:EGF-like domain-containing protein n=1 Tax=Helobdella robusta TaxID=6412 RepID=T1F3W4_HELRO|nr:hypothetical protein HELRODRAFT_171175 [Helobdella robusta]ESO05535.1 hypothetical protein HELRODRAFT_171175 [Helobdella robusta]